jgi:hypothetical protein
VSERGIEEGYLSSKVLSIHWTEAVPRVWVTLLIKYLANEQIRSQRIGLRLYAIALDPICPDSIGSSISLKFANKRISVAIL